MYFFSPLTELVDCKKLLVLCRRVLFCGDSNVKIMCSTFLMFYSVLIYRCKTTTTKTAHIA